MELLIDRPICLQNKNIERFFYLEIIYRHLEISCYISYYKKCVLFAIKRSHSMQQRELVLRLVLYIVFIIL
jgi:hypothetical protein